MRRGVTINVCISTSFGNQIELKNYLNFNKRSIKHLIRKLRNNKNNNWSLVVKNNTTLLGWLWFGSRTEFNMQDNNILEFYNQLFYPNNSEFVYRFMKKNLTLYKVFFSNPHQQSLLLVADTWVYYGKRTKGGYFSFLSIKVVYGDLEIPGKGESIKSVTLQMSFFWISATHVFFNLTWRFISK